MPDQSAKVLAFEAKKNEKAGVTAKLFNKENFDPNRKYLSVKLVHCRAFVDFINAKEDDYIYMSLSFLRQRFQSQA